MRGSGKLANSNLFCVRCEIENDGYEVDAPSVEAISYDWEKAALATRPASSPPTASLEAISPEADDDRNLPRFADSTTATREAPPASHTAASSTPAELRYAWYE